MGHNLILCPGYSLCKGSRGKESQTYSNDGLIDTIFVLLHCLADMENLLSMAKTTPKLITRQTPAHAIQGPSSNTIHSKSAVRYISSICRLPFPVSPPRRSLRSRVWDIRKRGVAIQPSKPVSIIREANRKASSAPPSNQTRAIAFSCSSRLLLEDIGLL